MHATYSGGSIDCRHRAISVEVSESNLSVQDSHRVQAKSITMLLILVEVYVKVACQSITATDCRHRAITMLIILVEVSVKVTCPSTTTTDCSHRAITMLLILVEVSVKVACRSTTARLQPQSYHNATYSGESMCESGLSVHDATQLPPCYLFWWKYL